MEVGTEKRLRYGNVVIKITTQDMLLFDHPKVWPIYHEQSDFRESKCEGYTVCEIM